MGSLLASSLISQAAEIANDENNVIWTQPQALAWLNDGQRAIAQVRPDASAITHVVMLTSGTKQTISGLRLLAVVRNMGTNGITAGRAVRLVERGLKDDLTPNWHADTEASAIKEYIYDDRIPQTFYVSPPVSGSTQVYVELSESVSPDDVAAVGDAITLDDIYAPAMIEWMVYRFFARDSEEVPDSQRAAMHLQTFFGLLDKKMNMDIAFSPKVRAQLK